MANIIAVVWDFDKTLVNGYMKVDLIESEEGPGYGAAILAAVGCGVFDSVEEAAKKLVKVTGTEEPDPATDAPAVFTSSASSASESSASSPSCSLTPTRITLSLKSSKTIGSPII